METVGLTTEATAIELGKGSIEEQGVGTEYLQGLCEVAIPPPDEKEIIYVEGISRRCMQGGIKQCQTLAVKLQDVSGEV